MKKIFKITMLINLCLFLSFFLFGRNSIPTDFHASSPYQSITLEKQVVSSGSVVDHSIDFNKLELNLEQIIELYLIENNIKEDQISVYITDLVHDQEVKINHRTPFIAASIYKLPLAMVYYDELNAGSIPKNQSYYYQDYQYEAGGPVGEYFYPGDLIELDYLLEVMIRVSDNTAGHILYNNFGGWEVFREEATKYSTKAVNNKYYEADNYLTTQYTNELLKYIYDHQQEYKKLLLDMENSFPTQYLNETIPYTTLQKTGYYDEHSGSVGLVLDEHPYCISVLTNLGYDGIVHMGNINQLVYDYYAQH